MSEPLGIALVGCGTVGGGVADILLRLLVADRPGVLADVTRILADEHISISSVVQHEAAEDGGGPVPLVIVTHYAETGRFKAAIAKINALDTVAAPAVFFSMGD